MNLREKILNEHSKANALRIADYACKSEENLQELFACFLADESVLAQRAAWSLGLAATKRPDLMQHHMKELTSVLSRENVHQALIRGALRVLVEVDIPKRFEGQVMESCFRLLEEPRSAPAIKVLSLTVLFNLSKRYPDIKRELRLIIEDKPDRQTAGFRSRGSKLLKELK
ncbi:MAG: hypothetical protein ACXVBH_02050 [Flavisolibacter sp.]